MGPEAALGVPLPAPGAAKPCPSPLPPTALEPVRLTDGHGCGSAPLAGRAWGAWSLGSSVDHLDSPLSLRSGWRLAREWPRAFGLPLPPGPLGPASRMLFLSLCCCLAFVPWAAMGLCHPCPILSCGLGGGRQGSLCPSRPWGWAWDTGENESGLEVSLDAFHWLGPLTSLFASCLYTPIPHPLGPAAPSRPQGLPSSLSLMSPLSVPLSPPPGGRPAQAPGGHLLCCP